MLYYDVCFICKKWMIVIGMLLLDFYGKFCIYVYWLCVNLLIEFLILIIINLVMREWFLKGVWSLKIVIFYEVMVIIWLLWSYVVVNVYEKFKFIVFYIV